MVMCATVHELPEDKPVTPNDLLNNHVEAMDAYANCAANHDCLTNWIQGGAE